MFDGTFYIYIIKYQLECNQTKQLNHLQHLPENCHYQGQIRGNPGSNVYLSTCNGLM